MKEKKRLSEVAQALNLDPQMIVEYISWSWVVPIEEQGPHFDEEDLARIRFIQELREDFLVNDEAVPIILHLVDQLNQYQAELRRLRECAEKKSGA